MNQSSDAVSQMAVTFPVPGSTTPGAAITVTLGFGDFGAQTSIDLPSAGSVATFSQFEQAAKAAQTSST